MFSVMNRVAGTTILLATVLAAGGIRSDPVGVYALIDRVVMFPDTVSPTTVQLWGVFALSDGRSGDGYQTPQRGYMYYTLPPGGATAARAARAEWSDHRAFAGQRLGTAYGSRYMSLGRVRRPGDLLGNPDIYPLNIGLTNLLRRPSDSGSVQFLYHNGPQIEYELHSVPNPQSPPDGGQAPAGRARLVTLSVKDTSLQYVFEIQGAGGARETSVAQPRGGDSTSYTTRMSLTSGAEYTWRVWTIGRDFIGPAATATFRAGR
jgi:hypothetical protein